jgi:hypothetical protein
VWRESDRSVLHSMLLAVVAVAALGADLLAGTVLIARALS